MTNDVFKILHCKLVYSVSVMKRNSTEDIQTSNLVVGNDVYVCGTTCLNKFNLSTLTLTGDVEVGSFALYGCVY